jgi:hypothetical protein
LLTFFQLTHKNETGTANRWEIANRNPPGRITISRQSEARTSQ